MTALWSIFILTIGIVFGSFFNVVGIRLPQCIPISEGRSYCPKCHHVLAWHELIPLFSYLLQWGRCRSCKKPISVLYPMMEGVTGILFLFAYWKLGLHIDFFIALLLISLSIIIFITDIRYLLIPNEILLFFLLLFIVCHLFSPLDPWYDAVVGAFIGFVLIALIIIASNGRMGAGDMKLLALLGFLLGFKKILLTFFLATLLGAVIGAVLLLMKKIARKQPVPFAPYIVIGALISYFYGSKIVQLYMSFIQAEFTL